MPTVSIPKRVSPKGDLVAVPRDVYEEFLAWQKKVKSQKIYRPTAAEKRMIAEGRKRIAAGKFVTLEKVLDDLERHR